MRDRAKYSEWHHIQNTNYGAPAICIEAGINKPDLWNYKIFFRCVWGHTSVDEHRIDFAMYQTVFPLYLSLSTLSQEIGVPRTVL